MSESHESELPSCTFCILPWTHLFADNRGVLFPCCFGMDAGTPVVDDAGEPVRVHGEAGVEPGWNSTFMRGLRKDMLEGRRPQACRMCYRYEDLGMSSYRQSANKEYRHCIDEVVANVDPEGTAPPAFRSIDLRLGNRCNLRCRMCSPHSSKALIPEWARLHQVERSRFDAYRHLDWFTDPAVWDSIETHAAQLERVTFAGGEPLLVPEHFDFLDRLIESGKARDLCLSYVTNATVLPERIWDIWPRFGEVRLLVSLDGYGPVNDFIRYPTRWDELDRNLRILDENADALNLSELDINTTVQVYNVLSLTELFDYTFTFERFDPYPNLSILVQPSCFDIQILPPDLKQEAVRRLEAFVREHDGRWRSRWRESAGRTPDTFLKKIGGVITHIMAADRQQEIGEFLRRNEVFDQYRGQTAGEILPDLAPLFTGRDAASGDTSP